LDAGRQDHGGVSIWKGVLRPTWVSDFASGIVAWCIQNHSLLNRLCRAIDEKIEGRDADVKTMPSYRHAVDPSFVRSRLRLLRLSFALSLEICTAIQKADLASVPESRHLLPVVDLAADVVRAGYDARAW